MTKTLGQMRKDIDQIDRKIIALLSARFQVAEKIGKYKKLHNLPAYDPKRKQQILKKISHPQIRDIFKKILSKTLIIVREHHQRTKNHANKK